MSAFLNCLKSCMTYGGPACLFRPLDATPVPRGWAETGPAEKLLLAGVRDRYWTPFCVPCCESFHFNSSVLSPDYLASHRLENVASCRARGGSYACGRAILGT